MQNELRPRALAARILSIKPKTGAALDQIPAEDRAAVMQ